MIILPAQDDPEGENLLRELEEDNAILRAEGKKAPAPGAVPIDKLRAFRMYHPDGTLKPVLEPSAFDETIALSSGERTIRVHRGENTRATFVHFHGGGWVLGSIYDQDHYLAQIAQRAGVEVVSVDYPLAPESGLDEIIRVAAEAIRAIGEARPGMPLVVGGESAGAHLAISATLRLKDQPAVFANIKGLNLLYGLYDLGMTQSQRMWGGNILALSTPYIEWFYDLALPEMTPAERSLGTFSPANADLKDMPPAHLIAGTLDPLIDDTRLLHERYGEAGNQVETVLFENAPHGFNGRATKTARIANRRIADWIGLALDG